MASLISHAVVAASLAAPFYKPQIPKQVWALGVLCAVVPDLDVIGFRFGVHYGDFWGHRGFTHSLLFAVLMASAALLLLLQHVRTGRILVFLYLLLASVSHGLLDAMTNGGLGVAFFSPFDNRRYFLPWRPIRVSPIGVGRFFSIRGYAVLQNEFVWVWMPALLFTAVVLVLRRRQVFPKHG